MVCEFKMYNLDEESSVFSDQHGLKEVGIGALAGALGASIGGADLKGILLGAVIVAAVMALYEYKKLIKLITH